MKTILRLAVRLYPRAWRARYGDEFQALLEELRPSLSIIGNVAVGGLRMQLTQQRFVFVPAAAFGLLGLAVAACLAFATSRRVESSGTMRLQRSTPVVSDVQLQEAIKTLADTSFSDQHLGAVIQRQDIRTSHYRDIRIAPAVDVAALRGDIRIWMMSSSPDVIKVAFASDDGAKTQQVTADLMRLLVDSALTLRESAELGSLTLVQVVEPAGSPYRSVSSRRVTLAGASGLGAGVLVGLVFAFARKRPSSN